MSDDMFKYGIMPKYDKELKNKIRSFCRSVPIVGCIHCGYIYKNPGYCIIIDDELQHCCQLCSIVTEFRPIDSQLVEVCESNMSQLEIIKKTVDYISKYKKMPFIENIDAAAKKTKIKPMKLITSFTKNTKDHEDVIIKVDKKTQFAISKLKLFFTNEINIANIVLRYVNNQQKKSDSVELCCNVSCVSGEEYININNIDALKMYDDKIISIVEKINRWNKKFLENSIEHDKAMKYCNEYLFH